MAEQQESNQTTKTKFHSDLFLVIGILSILIGFFTFFIPWIWGIPLTIAGLIMRRKDKAKGKRKEKLPFLTRLMEIEPLGAIDRIRSKFVSKQHVIGQWGHLIEGAQGKAGQIFKETEDLLKQSGVSSIEMERTKLMAGIIRGILGSKRDFLVVKDKNFRLKPYQILVNARDYGNNLDVAWYLTYRLSLIRWLLSIIPFVSFIPRTIEDLDLFDLQDLRAYNTLCHHSTLEAAEKLMRSLDQDVSKIDRTTRGFLGIS